MKVAIAEEKNGFPEFALIGHLFLPFTANEDFRPETTGADFRFSFGHTLGEKSSIGYNVGAQWGDDSPEVAYIYTLAYGYRSPTGSGPLWRYTVIFQKTRRPTIYGMPA